MGKCLDKLGKRPEAVDMLVSVLERHPLTWYSALAEDLLQEWGEGKRVPKHADLSKVAVRPHDPFAGLRMTPELRRLRVAIYLGEPDSARLVLDSVHKKLTKALGKTRLEELEADLADPLEEYAERRQDAMAEWQDVLKTLPTKDTVDHWRAIYPRAYATHVVAAAKRSCRSPTGCSGFRWRRDYFASCGNAARKAATLGLSHATIYGWLGFLS